MHESPSHLVIAFFTAVAVHAGGAIALWHWSPVAGRDDAQPARFRQGDNETSVRVTLMRLPSESRPAKRPAEPTPTAPVADPPRAANKAAHVSASRAAAPVVFNAPAPMAGPEAKPMSVPSPPVAADRAEAEPDASRDVASTNDAPFTFVEPDVYLSPPPPVAPPPVVPTIDRTAQHAPSPAARPGGVTTRPRPLAPPAPAYPILSRRLGEEGLVVLRITIGADGAVADIDVVETPGYPRLVQAAKDAVEKTKFAPALSRDRAADAAMTIAFHFKLTGGVSVSEPAG